VAVVDIDNGHFLVHEVVARVERHEVARRIRVFLERVEHLLDGPIWIEAPVLAGVRNVQSTIKVAQTTGIVHAVLAQTHEVAVSSWKKRTVGQGNASKPQVRDWLDEAHPDIARMCRGNQDLYDAACIALYGRAVQQELEASGLAALRAGARTD
jgi:Holliday junction resolvasome RuvABC endonuclease subunit